MALFDWISEFDPNRLFGQVLRCKLQSHTCLATADIRSPRRLSAQTNYNLNPCYGRQLGLEPRRGEVEEDMQLEWHEPPGGVALNPPPIFTAD
jgi:hypothetical protein